MFMQVSVPLPLSLAPPLPPSLFPPTASKSCHGHDSRLPVSQVIQHSATTIRCHCHGIQIVITVTRYKQHSYKIQDTEFGVSTQHSQHFQLHFFIESMCDTSKIYAVISDKWPIMAAIGDCQRQPEVV